MASLENPRAVLYTFVLIYLINIGITNSTNMDHTPKFIKIKGDSCNSVKSDFLSLRLELSYDNVSKGSICGGFCCLDSVETDLKNNAIKKFKVHIEHHTKRLQNVLEHTVEVFQKHLLELISQSKNKSISVFSVIYPAKLSKELLNNLYSTIIENIKPINYEAWIKKRANENTRMENVVNQFFVDLFPIAYHKAIDLNYDMTGDFHSDYINCLKHTYASFQLEPFGPEANELKSKLKSNIIAVNDFSYGLLESAKVLRDINQIDLEVLSETCKNQLLRMAYCPICKDIPSTNIRICHSYCLNVIRGCLAQLGFAEIDQSWAKVATEIESLVTNNIQSNGLLKSIKNIDNLLSTAVMNIINNGQTLKEKVEEKCGIPTFIKNYGNFVKSHPPKVNQTYTSTEFSPDLLSFLTTIANSKNLFTNVVNSLCSDSNVKNVDIQCWTGDQIGDYSYTLLMPGGAQKYNPEVPLSNDHSSDSIILHELVDRFYKISSNLGTTTPTSRYSDIQGDMAENDEESSGQYDPNDIDDEEETSGSGEHPLESSTENAPTGKSNENNSVSSTRNFFQSLVLLFIYHFIFII